MEKTSNLSVAKVKVEYHDPSGIFSLLADQFSSRLPLHNLNWKSPKRPLRSIESLHVDVVPSSTTTGSTVSNQTLPSTANPAKERRHQIPGLRQTPYLKLYLLRCDDADSYKSTYRKAVRDWLKSHTPASQSSSKKTNPQENHDAFEWMILHVVLPDTKSASQNTASPGPGGRPDSVGSDKGRLLNKGANTVLEKLRADFNGSNKSAVDRVAQLRLGSFGSQSTQDQREEWDEIVSKLKALILASFDLRVRQYEDDIQEKEAQRALPGWNFCTFFVLKEGLARGFESVGLIDDALAGYEELSAELESLLANEDSGPTASLLPFTKELLELYNGARNGNLSTDQNFWSQDNPTISSTKKNFRELILSNNISVFDFKCYVLARKMAVLLRMSRATKAGPEDLIPLGQLCQLAASSIPNISRVMREDLRIIAKDNPSENENVIIENIVASWVYTASQQVLGDTSSAFLAVSSPNEPHFSTLLKENQSVYPTRKSSLTSPIHKKQKDDAQALFDQLKGRSASSQPGAQNRSGKDYLATQRAVLVLLQRRLVETMAGNGQFTIGWAKDPLAGSFAAMKDVSLDAEDSEEEEQPELSPADGHVNATDGICNYLLYEASTSKKALRTAYESLTREALDLYYAAGQSKSFERMLADLAMVKYQSGDYAAAANYFAKIIPVYSHSRWTFIETEMLLVHAKCLKVLNRRDDYVRMLLGLLALTFSSKTTKQPNEMPHYLDIETYEIQGQSIIEELAGVAAQLPYDITVPLSTYFTNVQLDPFIIHDSTEEGFALRLRLKSVFEDDVILRDAKVVLSSAQTTSAADIYLESDTSIKISKGQTTIVLKTCTSTFGSFLFTQATLQFGRIQFVYNPFEDDQDSVPPGARLKPSRVLIYPRNDAFSVTTSLSRVIQIEQPRRLEIKCRNNFGHLKSVDIRLKPATSGLRIHNANAQIAAGTATIKANDTASFISLVELASLETVTISVPYELDDAHSEITVGLEITSNEPKLDYRTIQTITVELPLDINVHDLFKSDHIFQRFHIKTSNDIPLQILDLNFQDTDAFKVTEPPGQSFPTTVFAKHPATYMYEVRQIKGEDEADTKRQCGAEEAPLILTVDYQCYDELVLQTVLNRFSDDVGKSGSKSLQSLLVHTLNIRLRGILSASSYTEAALLGYIRCPDFQDIGWPSFLRDLPPGMTEELKSFLEIWHTQNQRISLPDSAANQDKSNWDTMLPRRTIVISVPLPHLDILQIASLKIPKLHNQCAAVGVGITAKLTLRHTRRWSIKSNIISPEFMYDIDAPTETWLIGGQRRGRFSAEEGEVKTWDVILIPLKTGKLLLPFIDVRVVGKDADHISCETEFGGFGQTLTVIGNLKSTTVTMDGNEARLISAENQLE